MNIFVTDECPIKSAENLDDKRVIKMVLESAQMLSTAMHVWCAPHPPYKITHRNHPCTVWARTTQANYQWLLDHFKALLSEYTYRYGKAHKCQQYVDTFQDAIMYVPAGERTPFANCTLNKEMDAQSAYRQLLMLKWFIDKRQPTWKNRSKPNW